MNYRASADARPARSIFANNLHLRVQTNAPLVPCRLSDDFNQREDIVRGGPAIVDDKVAVHFRDACSPDAGIFQSEFLHEFSGWGLLRGIFENATGAGRDGLRSLAFVGRQIEKPMDVGVRARTAVENSR